MKTRAILLRFALAMALFTSRGTAAPTTLGALQNPNHFNRTTFSGTIDYGVNLNTQTYEVRLPTNYDPTRTYGLVSFIDWVNPGGAPATAWQPILDQYDLIWVGGVNIGNPVATTTRFGAAIMGAFRMTELHKIDPARVFSVGTSGGAQLASELLFMRKDFFKGFIGLAGTSMATTYNFEAWNIIPGWSPPGRLDNTSTIDDDGTDYGWADWAYPSLQADYSVFPENYRFALITNETDFRRTEITGIYRYFFMNLGNRVKLIVRPGGHAVYEGSSFEEAVRYMNAPNATVLRDRFEDANLTTNNDPANTLERGSGFLNKSAAGASAAEVNYSYNSKTQKVLRLTPGTGVNAAVAEAKNRFNWTNPDGVTIDAKLRAELQAGNNQQIGIHLARGDSDDSPEDNPGLHVFLNHASGVKNRLVLIKADGSQVELAKWDHAGSTHPMAMNSGDKLFWYAPRGAEYCAKSLDFRGEDLRVVASDDGFQLTFARPAANLETNFPGKVILFASPANLTSGPNVGSSDGEDHRIVLQGRWSDLNLAGAVDDLAFRHWKLLLSNRAINPAATAGDALVDEITLLANAEETNFIPPAITTPGDLTVNATSGLGAIVNYSPTATAESGAPLTVTCSPPSGSGLPIGTTTVTCTATDSNSNTTTATFNVIVLANGFTPAPPSAPLPPAISPGLTAATLLWQTQNFATSYSVKRSSSAAGPFTTVASGLTTTSFTDTGLVHNVPAYYILTASNNAGESAPSTVASVTTSPGTAVKADNSAALDTLASWSSNQLPGAPDIALWNDTVTTSNTVSVGNGTTLAGIRLTNPGGNLSIASSGSTSLTLGASGLDLSGSVRSLTLTAPVVVAANQTWTSGNFGSPGDAQILADSVISGPGKLTHTQTAGRGLALLQANTFTGGFTLGAGASVSVGTSAGVTSGNTTSSAFGAYNGSQTLTIEGGTIDHAGFGFHARNVRITGDFTFLNNARINFGGAFDLAGGTRTMTLARSASNANTLVAGGNATLNLSSGGALVVSNGSLRIVADATVPAGNFVVLTPQSGTAFTNNAGLLLGDKVYYGKAGTGTLNGATTVPSVTLEAGSVWDLSDGNNARNPQVNSLSGAGSVVNTWASGGSGALHTLTLKGNTNNGRSDFSGRIFDDGGTIFPARTAGLTAVVKEGSTTQIFSGNNDYSGSTSVNGGTLLVNGSITSPAALSVATTATLGGSGSIASPITLNGTLAPGDGPGTLTLTGPLAMSTTSKLRWQLPANATTGAAFLNAAAVTVTSGAKLDLIFNAPGSSVSFTDPFWQSNRSWPVLSSTGLNGSFSIGTVSPDSAARTATAYGVFSLSHSNNNVTLNWTAYSAREQWNLLHYNSISSTGNAADILDSNKDGETNLLEFATGQSPHSATRAFTSVTKTTTDLAFTYTRNKAAFEQGHLFAVEYSDTLAPDSWTSAGPGTVILDGPSQNVRAVIPQLTADHRFVRLRVGTP